MSRRALVLVAAMFVVSSILVSGCGSDDGSGSHGPPSGTGTFKGIPVGFTQQGYPYLGNAGAPVTMEEFSDFLCPYCGRHVAQTLPTLLRDYVAKGKVKYVFRDMPLASLHPTAVQGHIAARCAADQSPRLFWAMHEELFRTQDRWRDLPDPARYLRTAAERIGADLGAYDACVATAAPRTWVDQNILIATRTLKFDSTPTFRLTQSAALAAKADPKASGNRVYTLVGAYPVETFEAWLSALVAGRQPPPQARPAPPKLPYWASVAGLAPDPGRPGFTKAGDPARGDRSAKVVVVEFSNFQCPACRVQAERVQPTIDRTFVAAGKARWVFKNLLLREFPQSLAAAAAAECAGEQGRFWQMHDLLFAKQSQWAISPPDAELERLAGELALDRNRFDRCLGSRQASERVLNDLYDAAAVTTTAPTYVILAGGKGVVVRGSPTARKLAGLIREQLRGPSAQAPSSKAPASTAVPRAGRARIELGTTDLGVGRNRISFVVLSAGSRLVNRPTARVWLAPRPTDAPVAEAMARLEPVGVPGRQSAELNVYVAHLEVPSPGTYRLLAGPAGTPTRAIGTVHIRSQAAAPSVGDRAVSIENPTLAGGVDPKRITTARPPDVELLRTSVADALAARRPFVVTFDSPLFCRKRACGPVVDVVRSVADRWQARSVDFIHVEVYEHNDVRSGYDEWVRAWGLPSDPFTYVVDRTGVIRTKLEGPFSANELDAAVRAVART